MKILFVISSTVSGGAERQFIELVKLAKSDHEVRLVILDRQGSMSKEYTSIGVPIQHYGTSSKFSAINQFSGLLKVLLGFRPSIVQTFLYKADILGTFASLFVPRVKVFWTAGNVTIPNFGKLKQMPLRILSRKQVSGVFANSEAAEKFHTRLGYPKDVFVRVPNFLPEKKHISAESPSDIPKSTKFKIGFAARAVEGKGHLTLLKAVSELNQSGHEVLLSLVGEGIESWEELKNSIRLLKISSCVELLPVQADLTIWYSSLDLFVLPSEMWESFPNVLAEAISINCPVISSDISDVATEIFDIREVFKAGSHQDLLSKILQHFEKSEDEVLRESARLNGHLHTYFENKNTFKIWDTNWRSEANPQ